MACVNRALPGKETGGMNRFRRMESELVRLFGRHIVRQAELTDPADLDLSGELMDEVHTTADALLRLAGYPDLQRAVVANMSPVARKVLCMWISDMDLAYKLAITAAKRAA